MTGIEAVRENWKKAVFEELCALADRRGDDPAALKEKDLVPGVPPKSEMGDIAFPLFPFAKVFRTSPQALAEELAQGLRNRDDLSGEVRTAGPYVNVVIGVGNIAAELLAATRDLPEAYGSSGHLKGVPVMVEFSCPNTNKPLHLGHLRNDALGESISRILRAAGADVRKVNLINDRGIHICKSMLAYREFGDGSTPESTGKKSDHFVGDYYVKFNQWAKENPRAEEDARSMLVAWEKNDPEVNSLWRLMNRWAIEGIEETYEATGISFDQIYYESQTYSLGKDEILKGLERGVFYKEEDGSIWVDLEEIGLDKKVLLRSDGTSLYLTQDIGTAIQRQKDWHFTRLVYVVGSEQQYHFRVLFHVLTKLGFEWAENLYHLSYGMVNLPEGKMKSREGTVVDADDLIRELTSMAEAEIREKEREDEVESVDETARKVALAALHYYLLQVSPNKDMIFNPKESLSFNGNTGPYLQYMGARISSMRRKFQERRDEFTGIEAKPELLNTPEERELIKLCSDFSSVIAAAADQYNPSLLASYLYELARTFSRYYHETPILTGSEKETAVSRLALASAVLCVLKNGMYLLNIPFVEKM
ncbi:arginine--tRNA ligase [Marispirochaeta aestuarii]|uniref:Arginine--tRNA ligase n=1 Tax=Marispirochaeta aestuarii TaxID=1963862 RepID=A0A1Y1S128_9SPIO|nr:arginine--tRNA ligase [Marispirochaeta aestuarii]ORC37200.1 arginine--tRNA ligase [Marispirochaeta aestuarii]